MAMHVVTDEKANDTTCPLACEWISESDKIEWKRRNGSPLTQREENSKRKRAGIASQAPLCLCSYLVCVDHYRLFYIITWSTCSVAMPPSSFDCEPSPSSDANACETLKKKKKRKTHSNVTLPRFCSVIYDASSWRDCCWIQWIRLSRATALPLYARRCMRVCVCVNASVMLIKTIEQKKEKIASASVP